MKRRIVQHGPCTLTVSLPAGWVHDFHLKKGDDINIEQVKEGLLLTTGKMKHFGEKHIVLTGMRRIITKSIAALYKAGYDEITVEYGSVEELEKIHNIMRTGYIGFEIVEETGDKVVIRQVSEPTQEEFKAIFRRIFHFLISTADESLDAAMKGDKSAYQKLILRDENINKLTDFCRRIVNKNRQQDYRQDTALYHIIEQLEKIGDIYKEINRHLIDGPRLARKQLAFYDQTNKALRMYEELFFNFTLQKADHFLNECAVILSSPLEEKEDQRTRFLLESITRELSNLSGATMILHI